MDLRLLIGLSTQVVRWWAWVMAAAAVLSTLTVERGANGQVTGGFRLTALTAVFAAMTWLPATLRLIGMTGGSIKTPAGEATTRGLLDVLGSLDPETTRDTLPAVIAALTSPEAFASTRDRTAIRAMRITLADDLAGASEPINGGVRQGIERYAHEYERLRAEVEPGHDRTLQMTTLTAEARALGSSSARNSGVN
jgi:hypothetical protein